MAERVPFIDVCEVLSHKKRSHFSIFIEKVFDCKETETLMTGCLEKVVRFCFSCFEVLLFDFLKKIQIKRTGQYLFWASSKRKMIDFLVRAWKYTEMSFKYLGKRLLQNYRSFLSCGRHVQTETSINHAAHPNKKYLDAVLQNLQKNGKPYPF